MAILIFGCGYLGRRVARLWLDRGETVYAVTRSQSRASELAAEGIRPLVADITADTQVALPKGLSTIVFAVGHDRGSRASIAEVYCGGLQRAIAWMRTPVDQFLYISSTGVYGQASGEDIDELSPCRPTREGGRACLDAESLLLSSRQATSAIILRLAGLYGPGRIPRAADLAAGRPIDAPADGWLNLIHVEDAARIVLLAAERAAPPRTYVVSDGHPVQRRDYYTELARLIGAEPARFVEPPPASPAAMRAASDKRINPSRMFQELAPKLLYPDFRAGLAAIVGSQ
jgi:nucleoside-diphosphate-sugar epimerase